MPTAFDDALRHLRSAPDPSGTRARWSAFDLVGQQMVQRDVERTGATEVSPPGASLTGPSAQGSRPIAIAALIGISGDQFAGDDPFSDDHWWRLARRRGHRARAPGVNDGGGPERCPPTRPPPFPLDLALEMSRTAPDDTRRGGVERTIRDLVDAVAEGRLDRAGGLVSGLVRLFAPAAAERRLQAWKRAWLWWEAEVAEYLPSHFEDTPPPGVLWPVRYPFTDRYGCGCTLVLDKAAGPATLHDRRGDDRKIVLQALSEVVESTASRTPPAPNAGPADHLAALGRTTRRAGLPGERDDDRNPGPDGNPTVVSAAPASAAAVGTGRREPTGRAEAGPMTTWVAVSRAVGAGQSTIRGHRARTRDQTPPLFADAEAARVWYGNLVRMPTYVAPPSPRGRRAPEVLPPAVDWKIKV